MSNSRIIDPPLDSGISLSRRRAQLSGAPPLTQRVAKGDQLVVLAPLSQSMSKGLQYVLLTTTSAAVLPYSRRSPTLDHAIESSIMLRARRLQQVLIAVAAVQAPTARPRVIDRDALEERPGMVAGRQQRQITVDSNYYTDRVYKGLGYAVTEVLQQSVAKGLQYDIASPLDQSAAKGLHLSIISPLQQSVSKGLAYVLLSLSPAPVVPLPVYPALVTTYPWTRRAGHHSVRSHVSASGREARAAQAEWPVWEWDIVYDYLPNGTGGVTESDMLTLTGFALDRRGSLLPFLLLDPSDYTVTSQLVGEGDGTTDTSYLLVRTLSATEGGTEPIGYLTELTRVSVGGVSLTPDQYSLETLVTYDQRLVLLHPPGVGEEVRVDMSYMFVVRMGVDDMELSEILEDLWQCSAMTLQSLKQ